jgi:hypothetical protein
MRSLFKRVKAEALREAINGHREYFCIESEKSRHPMGLLAWMVEEANRLEQGEG